MSYFEEPSYQMPDEFHLLEDSLRMDDIAQKLVELEVGIYLANYKLDAILRSSGIEPAPIPED